MTPDDGASIESDLEDVWHPARWKDRLGGEPLDPLFVLVLLASFAWNWIAKEMLPSAAWIPANCAFAVLLVAVVRSKGVSWEELGMRRDRLSKGVAVGIIAAGAIGLVLAIAVAVPATRSYFEDARVAADTAGSHIFKPIVRIPLGTVLSEETIFRSVLLALALRRWKVVTAVLVTSLAFGLWHVLPATGSADDGLGAVLGTFATTTFAGLLFVWLRLRANSVVAPMLAHFATNSLGYLAAVIALDLR